MKMSVRPDCPIHKIPMELVETTDKILTFLCPEGDCKEMKDVLRVFISRDDPILDQIKGWKDLL